MKDAMQKVESFHRAFGLPVCKTPGIPNEQLEQLRLDLMWEEVTELNEAVNTSDVTEIADALADIVYIACGTALTYGIPLDRVFDAVHESNMKKLFADGKPRYRADGKVLKPGDWQPPRIKEAMEGV